MARLEIKNNLKEVATSNGTVGDVVDRLNKKYNESVSESSKNITYCYIEELLEAMQTLIDRISFTDSERFRK